MSGHKRQTSGKAPQTWATPVPLWRALEVRYVPDGFDLDAAATADNAITEHWLGPGSSLAEDALGDLEASLLYLDFCHAAMTEKGGLDVWLNPPFARVQPFAELAMREVRAGRWRMAVVLAPSRVDTPWWRQLEHMPPGLVAHRDPIEGPGRVAFIDPTPENRSRPAEGVTAWVLRRSLTVREIFGERRRAPSARRDDGAAVKETER